MFRKLNASEKLSERFFTSCDKDTKRCHNLPSKSDKVLFTIAYAT